MSKITHSTNAVKEHIPLPINNPYRYPRRTHTTLSDGTTGEVTDRRNEVTHYTALNDEATHPSKAVKLAHQLIIHLYFMSKL